MTLKEHIEKEHDGSVIAFALKHGFNRASVYRWLDNGALWHDDNVYINTTKRPD